MPRSTCPTPTLVGTKSMNNQQKSNRTNLTIVVDRQRPCGAAKKRFHYLIKKGMTTEEAKLAALKPIKNKMRKRLACVGGKNTSGKQQDNQDTGNVRADPAEYSAHTSNPAITQSQRIPIQARLGAPVNRNTIRTVPTPAAFAKIEQLEMEMDDEEQQLGEPDLNVAILPGEYPSELWTRPQLEAVQKSIIDLVQRQPEDSSKPEFSECRFRRGWLSVRGNDIRAVNWLMAMDTRLRPWEGASLKVMPESEVPMERIFVGLFPALEGTSVKHTLRLIERSQNEGLAVDDWRVLHRAQRGPIMKLTLSIDSHSAAVLKKRRYNLSYGFTSVQFRPKEKPK